MIHNDDMVVTSTIRYDTNKTNDRSVISPTSHSVPSNIEHSVECEVLCQRRVVKEMTDYVCSMMTQE